MRLREDSVVSVFPSPRTWMIDPYDDCGCHSGSESLGSPISLISLNTALFDNSDSIFTLPYPKLLIIFTIKMIPSPSRSMTTLAWLAHPCPVRPVSSGSSKVFSNAGPGCLLSNLSLGVPAPFPKYRCLTFLSGRYFNLHGPFQ